jgi:hypothetical protein
MSCLKLLFSSYILFCRNIFNKNWFQGKIALFQRKQEYHQGNGLSYIFISCLWWAGHYMIFQIGEFSILKISQCKYNTSLYSIIIIESKQKLTSTITSTILHVNIMRLFLMLIQYDSHQGVSNNFENQSVIENIKQFLVSSFLEAMLLSTSSDLKTMKLVMHWITFF